MRAQANILTNPVTLGGRDQTNSTVFQGTTILGRIKRVVTRSKTARESLLELFDQMTPQCFLGQNAITPSTAIISSTLEDFILTPSFSQSWQRGLQSLSQQNKNRRRIKARWIQSTTITQFALPRNSPVVQSMVHYRTSLL